MTILNTPATFLLRGGLLASDEKSFVRKLVEVNESTLGDVLAACRNARPSSHDNDDVNCRIVETVIQNLVGGEHA